MKKLILFSGFLLLSILHSYPNEKIIRFHSDIVIEADGKIEVTETIRVKSEGWEIRRGIIRSIPTVRKNNAGKKKKVDINVLSVTRDKESEPYKIEKSKEYSEIYIGDSNTFLDSGVYEYMITYESYGHIGFFDEFDELYWNVTGSDWAFSIEEASARIVLPDSTVAINTACYTGIEGSANTDCSSLIEENSASFTSNNRLMPGEGFTVAVSFPRDIIKRPPPPSKAEQFWDDYKQEVCAVLGILIMGLFFFFTWRKVGKDPKKPTVIPTFKALNGWSPAAMRYLYNHRYDNKVFTSALVNIAVKGNIRIKNEKKKYTLTKTDKDITSLSPEESAIFQTLLNGKKSLLISNANHSRINKADSLLKKSLENTWNIKKYFLNNASYVAMAVFLLVLVLIGYIILTGMGVSIVATLATLPFILIGLSLIVTGIRGKGCSRYFCIIAGALFCIPTYFGQFVFFFQEGWITGTFISVLIIGFTLYNYLIKAPTELGAKAKAEIEGFKMYLETAEENRLNLLTPPEHTPQLFEEMLPYAIALDVENKWGEKFDSLLEKTNYNPEWYVGSDVFSANVFTRTFSSTFSSSVQSSKINPNTSSGSSSGSHSWSSGSSGGGFSGGGGGGGGGRGW